MDSSDGWGFSNLTESIGQSVFKEQIRKRVMTITVDLLSSNDPGKLENYILAQTPIVENHITDKQRSVLQKYGPQYADEIVDHTDPDQLLEYMDNADEWVEEGRAEDVQECADIIRETPGGVEWLHRQSYTLWKIAGIA